MGLFTVKMVIDGVEFVGRCNGQQLNELKDNVKADQGMGCHLVVSKVEVVDDGSKDVYEEIEKGRLTLARSNQPDHNEEKVR